jgi:excisionase family DNA binding protein
MTRELAADGRRGEMQIITHDGITIAVYTVAEAAAVLGLNPMTIRRWGNAHRITELRTAGKERQRLYPQAEIDGLAAGWAESARVFGMTPEEAREELQRRRETEQR